MTPDRSSCRSIGSTARGTVGSRPRAPLPNLKPRGISRLAAHFRDDSPSPSPGDRPGRVRAAIAGALRASRRALASRIATGPSSPDSIRALIESDPSVIQPGLRLLDFDIKTGPETTLDAIGVDPSGSLAIVA